MKIRLTHRRQTLKIATNIYVAAHQITRSCRLKDQAVIDATDATIVRWRAIVGELGIMAEEMTAREVYDHIRATELRQRGFALDFVAYIRKVGATHRPGTAKNYTIAANALERYMGGSTLDISKVSARLLVGFEHFLRTEPSQRGSNRRDGEAQAQKGDRAVSLYMSILRAAHNRAKQEFNDEELGVIRIPLSPFDKYRIPAGAAPKKRAVSIEVLQRIANLSDEDTAAETSRRDLARDCFLLSFGLAGMNAIDLFTCPAQPLRDDVIVYNRTKTASRRADAAEMHIRIEPQIAPLVAKYKDPTGQRLFRFHTLYKDGETFNRALNKGLERIDAALRANPTAELEDIDLPEHITFYAARHSWATIARSAALNIDKYTVHEALNHVDEAMKITDRYIDRDWSVIWRANAAVVGLLDWSAVEKRARDEK